MSFILRQITRRAGGGEIVRPLAFDNLELTIGRGGDQNVQIPDLGVMLRHARIVQLSANRLLIEATGGVPVEVDGAFTRRIEVGAARKTRLVLGSHLVTIEPAEKGEDIAVTAERVVPLSEQVQPEDEKRIFGVASVMPGKRAMAWTLGLAILALFLAWPIWAFMERRAPSPADDPIASARPHAIAFESDRPWLSGPLSKPHAMLEDSCESCHAKPFEAVRDRACVTCHENVADHAEADKLLAAHSTPGFEAKLRALVGTPLGLQPWGCTGCHSEHDGAAAMPLNEGTFCSDCHTGLSKRVETTLLDASDFKDGHPEFRPEIVAVPATGKAATKRVSLADRPTEITGLKFPHKLHLDPLSGVTRMARVEGFGGGLDCGDCHKPDATGVRFTPTEMERDCATCHDLVFGEGDRVLRHGYPRQVVAEMRDYFRLNGLREGPVSLRRRPGGIGDGPRARLPGAPTVEGRIRAVFSDGGACYDCHTVIAPASPRSLDFQIAPVSFTQRYLTRAWFDHRDHATAESPCESCHAAKTSTASADLLLPGIAQCRDCHVGAHPEKGKVTSNCASCHTYHIGLGAPPPATARERRPEIPR